MGLRDTMAVSRLLLALRRIWYGARVVTPRMVAESIAIVYEFLTGRRLP